MNLEQKTEVLKKHNTTLSVTKNGKMLIKVNGVDFCYLSEGNPWTKEEIIDLLFKSYEK